MTNNGEEQQYLDLCAKCLDSPLRPNRTGTPAYTTFGTTMRFDLSGDRVPLLTTRAMPWRSITKELLWFISGNTSSNVLHDQGCKFWDANGTKEFLQSRGLGHREQGDLGPVYGFQWRHWGAHYVDSETNYEGRGIDQLSQLIFNIKRNPEDRRLILSAWNVEDLPKMALPPCHMMCQFDVQDDKLSCMMIQRSADMGLGVPANIFSYALLTRMVAQVCDLEAKELVHVMGNTHIYKTHEEKMRQLIARRPNEEGWPTIHLDETVNDIDQFRMSHFELRGYHPQSKLEMKMCV